MFYPHAFHYAADMYYLTQLAPSVMSQTRPPLMLFGAIPMLGVFGPLPQAFSRRCHQLISISSYCLVKFFETHHESIQRYGWLRPGLFSILGTNLSMDIHSLLPKIRWTQRHGSSMTSTESMSCKVWPHWCTIIVSLSWHRVWPLVSLCSTQFPYYFF